MTPRAQFDHGHWWPAYVVLVLVPSALLIFASYGTTQQDFQAAANQTVTSSPTVWPEGPVGAAISVVALFAIIGVLAVMRGDTDE